jgi:hypothetical protein
MPLATSKKASPEEVRSFLRKFYQFLRDGHVIKFRKMGWHGFIHFDEVSAVVKLDHRKELFPTIIHEAMHFIYPEWSEEKVLRKEAMIVNALSERQVRNVIKRFADAI